MALVNTFYFVQQLINWDEIAKATHNQFKVVSVRPYTDKKGILPEGYNMTLMVLQDDFDYGVDKNGAKRENNVFQNFDVTVLNRKTPVKKGDMVSLKDFDQEHSYVLGFDLLLRFKDYEVIPQKNNA